MVLFFFGVFSFVENKIKFIFLKREIFIVLSIVVLSIIGGLSLNILRRNLFDLGKGKDNRFSIKY